MSGYQFALFAVGILATGGVALILLVRQARRTFAEAETDPENRSIHLARFGKSIGAAMGYLAGLVIALAYLNQHRNIDGWFEACWAMTFVAICLIYVGGCWIALGLEKSLFGGSWRRASRLRAVTALGSATWLPLMLGAAGPLAANAVPLPRWVDGAWIPIGILYVHYCYRVIPRFGSTAPLPPEISAAYAKIRRVEPPLPAYLLETGDAGIANALAESSPRGRSIYVTDRLAEALSPEEAAAIMVHEEGHLVHRHMTTRFAVALLWQTTAAVLLWLVGSLNGVSASAAYIAYLAVLAPAISRRGERAADRYASGCVEDAEILGRALGKLHAAAHLPEKWEGRGRRSQSHPDLVSRLDDIGAKAGETGDTEDS